MNFRKAMMKDLTRNMNPDKSKPVCCCVIEFNISEIKKHNENNN